MVSPTRSPMVCAMRSALARAAIRRGSSTIIFLFFSQGASSSASGTRVVLPAPGGATSTAALWLASVRASWSSTASIGRGVSKVRGNCGSRSVLPLSPCGRGWLRCEASQPGEGSVSADVDPSSGTDFAQPMQGIGVLLKNGGERPPTATFSHKGRREESASFPRVGRATDTLINETERRHILGTINVAEIDDHGLRHFALQAFEVERAVLHPLGHDHHGVGAAHAGIGIVAIFDIGQFAARLLHADGIMRAYLRTHVEQPGHQRYRRRLAHVV